MRTWFCVASLLIAGCATAPKETISVAVGVISTEQPIWYSANTDPAFVDSQHRLAASYGQAVADAAERYLVDVRLPKGGRCDVVLTLLPSGYVVGVEPGQCSFSPTEMKAVSDALANKTLPYKGYESVFTRHAHMAICSPKSVCGNSPVKAN